MASSDDEGDIFPSVVSDYYFEDDNGEPISFAELPLKWNDAESLDGSQNEIVLRGKTDNGLQTIFERVTAWKFDISHAKPEILVVTRKRKWINLLKPRKSFEKTISKVLTTVHCLSFVRMNPEASRKALWDHLAKLFSSYDSRPSEVDLLANLIIEAVKQFKILAGSQVLATLEDKTGKKKVFEEVETVTRSSLIVDDVPDENDESGGDGSDDEDEDFFENVCAICDNGGDILCCGGKCLRSFHATKEAGADSNCKSLGFSDEKYKEISNQIFECKNCQYKQHQCFVCGELGSSDKSAGAEVFQCVTGTCGYFYHPHCVAKALQFKMGGEAKDLESEIPAGKPFVCPIHTCFVCKESEPEEKNDLLLQFAVCRRCPRAYHRKCLPRKIAFEEDEDQGILQRAWEGLMPNKILIYCTKHKIEEELATPVRNHIKFPDTEGRKKKKTSDSVGKRKVLREKKDLSVEDAASKNPVGKKLKSFQKSSSAVERVDFTKANEGRSSLPESSKKQKLANYTKTGLKKSFPRKDAKSIVGYSKATLGEQLYEQHFDKDSRLGKRVRREASDAKEQVKDGRHNLKEVNYSMMLDADSKERILLFMREAEARITLEDVVKEHKAPSMHASSSMYVMQNITLGKVECSIKALKAALQKLEEGGSLEDAKAICEPGLLNQIAKWKSKLKLYLNPFQHGMRYTSFGRHFTKVDKLQAIVDKLHSYVVNGDTIVDFCCGANDFSWLMKQKMNEVGKSCKFKNYDCFPAKIDFNFEKKDWMTVQKGDLPSGSELIMGLNPPFGTHANKFIDKALEFKPKLLILIVPQETVRLDENRDPYDLVWEDDKLLIGKAFYLPGSIDVNDKQIEDWNVNSPSLYLWSRPDWTTRHTEIAQQQGHLPSLDKMIKLEEKRNIPDRISTMLVGGPGLQDFKQLQERDTKATETRIEEFCNNRGHQPSLEDHDRKDQAKGNCEEGNKNERKRSRESKKTSPMRKSLPRHSSPNACSRSWDQSKHTEMPSHTREGYHHFGHASVSGLHVHRERGYDNYEGDRRVEEPYLCTANKGHQPVVPEVSPSNRQLGINCEQNSMMNTSVMQRYAPRLDELNTTRMNNVGSVQHLDGINGFYNTPPHPGGRPRPLGFVHGPYRPYSGQGSSGWLNE
ncbi:hypothetical protein ACH5RR_038020 [Cinchona calisaya]|uniref:Zinc finger PHD-type domain-containing protein n=1 Tax=Cinchona calisaya TaxID=153742 RepID=A0ABD2Y7W8_9GENT